MIDAGHLVEGMLVESRVFGVGTIVEVPEPGRARVQFETGVEHVIAAEKLRPPPEPQVLRPSPKEWRAKQEARQIRELPLLDPAEWQGNPAFATDAKADAIYARLSGSEPTAPARQFMSMSLGELAHGKKKWIGRARDVHNSGMHSTSDFPIALGSAMNRRLVEMMKAADSGISEIATPATVNDFRVHQEVQMSSFPSLEKVNEGGEITYGTLQEKGETYRIDSYARAITISFQALVNDDLGAINRSTRDTAFGAVERKSKLLIAALNANLADGKALFHADHANLAGAGAGISQATLSAGRLAMRMQKALDSETPLGIAPRTILVPAALETDAEAIVSAIQAATVDDVNVFAGKLRVAVEARLTGNAWYLFADPKMHPVIKFATLVGFEAPSFEVNEEFDRLGTSYRVHWHIGAAPIDSRGAYKNPGS